MEVVHVNVTDDPAHTVEPGDTEIVAVDVTTGLMVITIGVLVTVGVVTQPKEECITHFTASPLIRDDVVYVGDVPINVVFTYQSYVGVPPPPNGVGVKVTDVPAHTVEPGEAATDTLGVTVLDTVIVTVLLITVVGTAHGAVLVICTQILSPVIKPLLE